MDLTEYRRSPREQARLADLMNIIPKGHSTVLDIGARDGYVSRLLTQHFDRVTALDLEQPGFSCERVTTVKGNVLALDFPDRSFDVTFCAEVLEHINPADLPKACAEIVRVTRHAAVIGVPYRQDLRVGRTTCAACGGINPPWAHLNVFDEGRLTDLFQPLYPSVTTFIGKADSRTNALSAALLNWGGNPWGSYNQEEPCIHCGKTIVRPERSNLQKVLSMIGTRLCHLQGKISKPGPMWIHEVFTRNKP